MAVTLGVGALTRACSGMWQYLTERVRGRTQVQLERARNDGTAEVLRLLPLGGELWETETGGRTRIIRMPAVSGGGPDTPNRTELPPR